MTWHETLFAIQHAHAGSKPHIVCVAASERWPTDTRQFRRLLNTVCADCDIPDGPTQLAFPCSLNGPRFRCRTPVFAVGSRDALFI
jgi:hypothetical protein